MATYPPAEKRDAREIVRIALERNAPRAARVRERTARMRQRAAEMKRAQSTKR